MLTLTQDSAAASNRRGGMGGGVAEQYYALAHWLRPTADATPNGSHPSKSIGITSCASGAGISTVAANLAAAVATTGNQRVLLVNLSGSDSPLLNSLGVENASETRDRLLRTLSGELSLETCAATTSVPNLYYLGGPVSTTQRLSSIDGGRIVDLLYALERHFAFMVIDLPTTDSGLCFSTVGTLDGVLLVMDGQRTQSALAARAKQRLIQANAAVLGIILNQHTRELPRWLDARL